eukprot:g12460.t1 g12460   contig6:1964156-1965621(-)
MKVVLSTSAVIAAVILFTSGVDSFAPVEVAKVTPTVGINRASSSSSNNFQQLYANVNYGDDGDAPSRRNRVSSTLLQKHQHKASAPIVLRAAKQKDDMPMVQAMKKAEELKKRQSTEEFEEYIRKCNDIEDSEGKKARADYEKQYQMDKDSKEAKKVADVETLKRDLLDEGKDPNTDLDAEKEVFQFEHGIDLEKISGTPQNEQMIKNFQSKGKNIPTFASQRHIVKCQVADLKARGIDPLTHFSQPEVMEKTRAIYKMDDKVAAKVAKQYEALMEQRGGRLSPAQSNVPKRKAASRSKRAAEKEALRQERATQRQTKKDAKAKAKADRLAAKQNKQTPTEVVIVVEEELEIAPDKVAAKAPVVSSTSKKSKSKAPSKMNSRVSVRTAGTVVVGAGAAAFGFKVYSSTSQTKRNEQYKSIMGGSTDNDDDWDDDDDYDEE